MTDRKFDVPEEVVEAAWLAFSNRWLKASSDDVDELHDTFIAALPLLLAPAQARVEAAERALATERGRGDQAWVEVERALARATAAESRVAQLTKERDTLAPLARLALWVLEQQREWCADVDGGDIQDRAVEFGVIAPVEVAEPCDPEHCVCAETDNFPGDCFRDTEATKQARSALQGGSE